MSVELLLIFEIIEAAIGENTAFQKKEFESAIVANLTALAE